MRRASLQKTQLKNFVWQYAEVYCQNKLQYCNFGSTYKNAQNFAVFPLQIGTALRGCNLVLRAVLMECPPKACQGYTGARNE